MLLAKSAEPGNEGTCTQECSDFYPEDKRNPWRSPAVENKSGCCKENGLQSLILRARRPVWRLR